MYDHHLPDKHINCQQIVIYRRNLRGIARPHDAGDRECSHLRRRDLLGGACGDVGESGNYKSPFPRRRPKMNGFRTCSPLRCQLAVHVRKTHRSTVERPTHQRDGSRTLQNDRPMPLGKERGSRVKIKESKRVRARAERTSQHTHTHTTDTHDTRHTTPENSSHSYKLDQHVCWDTQTRRHSTHC